VGSNFFFFFQSFILIVIVCLFSVSPTRAAAVLPYFISNGIINRFINLMMADFENIHTQPDSEGGKEKALIQACVEKWISFVSDAAKEQSIGLFPTLPVRIS